MFHSKYVRPHFVDCDKSKKIPTETNSDEKDDRMMKRVEVKQHGIKGKQRRM